MTTASTHDPTVENVTASLNALGNTHDAVADALLAGGHRGEPDCDRCPVANYLAALYPGWTTSVTLVEDDETLWANLSREGDDYTETVEVELLAAVADFVRRFDRGEHPRLDNREAVRP